MSWNKGNVSTPDNPGRSKFMLWIRDVALPYQGDDCLIWPFSRDPNGYAGTVRQGKRICIHRYICELVHGAPPTPKHHAAHSCHNGSGGCVSPRHLSWKTNAENQHDRYDVQPHRRRQKLSAEQVQAIRDLKGKESTGVTAQRFGVSEAHTRHIQDGRARTGARYQILTDEQVRAIHGASGSNAQVGVYFGVSKEVARRIRVGETYKDALSSQQERADG